MRGLPSLTHPLIMQVTTEILMAVCSEKDLYNNIQGVYSNYFHLAREEIDSEKSSHHSKVGKLGKGLAKLENQLVQFQSSRQP